MLSCAVGALLLVALIGRVYFGEWPSFGKHTDPAGLGIEWISDIAFMAAFLSIFIIPAIFIMLITQHLSVKKPMRQDKLLLLITGVLLVCFFWLSTMNSSLYAWIMD